MTINLNREQAREAARLLAERPDRSVSIAGGFDFDQPGPSRVLVFGDEVHVIDAWGRVVQLAPSEAGCPTCGAYPNEDCKRPVTENCLHPKAERQSKVSQEDERGVIEVFDRDAYRAAHPDAVVMGCGACGRSWDDSHVTAWTPTPSARCPFEDDHEEGGHGRLFEATVTLQVSIPVEADDSEQAIDIACGEALNRHLANGNFEVVTTEVE